MEDYNNFKVWKSSRSTLMQDLAFSTLDSVFIYTSFKMTSAPDIDEKQILFAEGIEEAAGYFRHIFLYDLLVDVTDDLELDEALRTEERQKDALFLLNLWFKTGKALHNANVKNALLNFIKEFNQRFNNCNNLQYEVQILDGVNELKEFLESKFKDNENFNQKRLATICSNKSFDGESLKYLVKCLFEK